MNRIIMETDSYCLKLETVDELDPFIHLDIKEEYTVSLYKDLLHVLEGLLSILNEKGYSTVNALVNSSDSKLMKFSERFGFQYNYSIHGGEYHVYTLET